MADRKNPYRESNSKSMSERNELAASLQPEHLGIMSEASARLRQLLLAETERLGLEAGCWECLPDRDFQASPSPGFAIYPYAFEPKTGHQLFLEEREDVELATGAWSIFRPAPLPLTLRWLIAVRASNPEQRSALWTAALQAIHSPQLESSKQHAHEPLTPPSADNKQSESSAATAVDRSKQVDGLTGISHDAPERRQPEVKFEINRSALATSLEATDNGDTRVIPKTSSNSSRPEVGATEHAEGLDDNVAGVGGGAKGTDIEQYRSTPGPNEPDANNGSLSRSQHLEGDSADSTFSRSPDPETSSETPLRKSGSNNPSRPDAQFPGPFSLPQVVFQFDPSLNLERQLQLFQSWDAPFIPILGCFSTVELRSDRVLRRIRRIQSSKLAIRPGWQPQPPPQPTGGDSSKIVSFYRQGLKHHHVVPEGLKARIADKLRRTVERVEKMEEFPLLQPHEINPAGDENFTIPREPQQEDKHASARRFHLLKNEQSSQTEEPPKKR